MALTPAVPRISVLIPGLRGIETVRAAIDAWDTQTCRSQLELVVLCPDPGPAAGVDRIVPAARLGLHVARARAVHDARADFVMIAEDHCLPDADAAEHLIHSLDDGWDIVAPALRSADPRALAARAAFAIGYSEWMEPIESGESTVLPGHNTVIRRSALVSVGDELPEYFRGAAFLSRRLLLSGCRGFLNADARMRHFDSRSWSLQARVFGYVGLGFGATRTRRWPLVARWLYPLAAPAVVVRHYRRVRRQLSRRPDLPRILPGVAVLATAWGLCEGIGAILGVERVQRCFEITEVKPVSADAVARADEYARAARGR